VKRIGLSKRISIRRNGKKVEIVGSKR